MVVLVESLKFDATAREMPLHIVSIIIWATVEVNLAIISGKLIVHTWKLLCANFASLSPDAPTHLPKAGARLHVGLGRKQPSSQHSKPGDQTQHHDEVEGGG